MIDTDPVLSDVIAVVVSFNGGEKTVETFKALSEVVSNVLIIDNGSSADNLSRLRKEVTPPHSIFELGANFGIGHALNIGIEQAKDQGFKWVLTMDQDTIVHKDLLISYERFLHTTPNAAILAPSLSIFGKPPKSNNSKNLEYAITSGNLVRLDVYEKVGLYNEDLFIDKVDFEFCLRARRGGFDIFQVEDALIFHELGDQHENSGPLGRFYTAHSPLRRYYMSRNICYLVTRYFRFFPSFIFKMAISHFVYIMAILYFEDRQNASTSMRYMARGALDHFKNKYGPYHEN